METSIKATALETLDMGIDGRNPGSSRQGGTALDDDEMHRMGKVQEFKVCSPFVGITSTANVLLLIEKHATSCGIELCISLASHLGISDHVRQLKYPFSER